MLWERTRSLALSVATAMLALPETLELTIKGTPLMPSDTAKLGDALDSCRHDDYSDVDIHVKLRVHPDDMASSPFYVSRTDRIGLDKLYGMSFSGDCMRVCTADGGRMDISMETVPDPNMPHIALSHAYTPEQLRALETHFIQIQALGKLFRGDYLISSHLALEMLQTGLVVQMQLRDAQYGTNIHRYGYRETLEYTSVHTTEISNAPDDTFRSIAEMIYASAVAFEELYPQLVKTYSARLDEFIALYNLYMSTL